MSKIILVTGGAGHIASHIIEELVKDKNNHVISLDNYFNGSTKNHIAGAEYRRGHTKNIFKIIPEKPDIVYHLGEYARVAPSLKEPSLVHDLNTIGTFQVVEFCRIRAVKKLLYTASSTKFATEGDGRHQTPYSLSKAANVDLINDYARWYKLPYAICYFYNAFGPREKGIGPYSTLIAHFQELYLQNKALTVIKPGTQKRNFTYVKDLAKGAILVANKGNGDSYTLANPKTYSIIEIAKAFGGPIKYIDNNPGRQGSKTGSNKAQVELGWSTSLDVIDYIKNFVKTHPKK